MVRLVCRHFAADERFARRYRNEHSPEFPLTLPFSGIFQGFSACGTQTTLKITVSGRCACVCVCVYVCIVYVVRCCACGKTLKTRGNREKCVWYGVCVVWCCEVIKYTKTRETLGKITKHGLFFGTVWPSKDRKKVQNWPFSPTHCFYVFPGICRRFWPEVLTQTPKNAVFRPRSYSKGPNHALEKVLTKETPGIAFYTIVLRLSIFQLSQCNLLEVHPEG